MSVRISTGLETVLGFLGFSRLAIITLRLFRYLLFCSFGYNVFFIIFIFEIGASSIFEPTHHLSPLYAVRIEHAVVQGS
jgi:hypothetical protein